MQKFRIGQSVRATMNVEGETIKGSWHYYWDFT